VGYAARQRQQAKVEQRVMGDSLAGLKVAIDVQHIGRPWPHAGDRGTRFLMVATQATLWESDCALQYAQAAGRWLRERGAQVRDNHPAVLATYSTRNRTAAAWGCDAYLACHVNAGNGNYPLTEHMSGAYGQGQYLGAAIGNALHLAFPVLLNPRSAPLLVGQRGAVCIESVPLQVAAVIVEPFFGDNPSHQSLMTAPQLQAVGEAIAQGVAEWWHGSAAPA
jgi:N-acetylmuramoyl-L-alanine amidase